MKRTLIERNIALLLFILVMITFSLAQRDTKKMEKAYSSTEIAPKKTLAADIAIKPLDKVSPSN